MGDLILDCSAWGILERLDKEFRGLPSDEMSGYMTLDEKCADCDGRGQSCHALSGFLMDIEFRKCEKCNGEGRRVATFRVL